MIKLIEHYWHRTFSKLKNITQETHRKYVLNEGIKIYPKVQSIDLTIDEILINKRSIARFGDGEFTLCLNKSISFQKRNNKLKKKLKEILRNDNPNCLVAILEYNPDHYNNFWYQFWYENTKYITSLLNKKSKYFHASITRSSTLEQFNKLINIWSDRDVIFIFGKDARFDSNHEVFDNIKNSRSIVSVSQNAWQYYDEIFNAAISESRELNNPVILISLGPTATVLAYELSKLNLQTIDLGHFTNVYNQIKYNTPIPESL